MGSIAYRAGAQAPNCLFSSSAPLAYSYRLVEAYAPQNANQALSKNAHLAYGMKLAL